MIILNTRSYSEFLFSLRILSFLLYLNHVVIWFLGFKKDGNDRESKVRYVIFRYGVL